MYEVIRWVSIVLMWVAVAMNLLAWFRWHRAYKQLKAREKYCATMINACTEFLEAELKEEAQNGRND